MSSRLIDFDDTHELTFDNAGRPLHCGTTMDDDGHYHACRFCERYVTTDLMEGVRERRARGENTY